MARRSTKKPLTAGAVRLQAKPGRYPAGEVPSEENPAARDSSGLYLLVRSATRKSWIFRYSFRGKVREMGFGHAGYGQGMVTLATAGPGRRLPGRAARRPAR